MLDFSPTPIQYLGNLFENEVYVKREDLLPFSFGGNKVRIAQEYFQDMEKLDKNVIVTYGSPSSNLNRVIANLARTKNIKCYVVSNIDVSHPHISFNTLLCESFGANVIKTTSRKVGDTLEDLLLELEKKGESPYYINGNKYGDGRKEIPVRAYQKVYQEISIQEAKLGIKFDKVFLAIGTASTFSGLLVGAELAKRSIEFIGISIARKSERNVSDIEQYLEYSKLQKKGTEYSSWTVTDRYLCGGYGKYNQDLTSLKDSVLNDYGIPLDLTYTAKSFFGMKEYLRETDTKKENVLYIHTGGTPLFFDELRNKYEKGQ